MPAKQQNHAEVNNFSGGLITEATELNFPPNSFSDISNFVINRNGSLTRRLGMDNEPGSPLVNTGVSESVSFKNISTYRWKEVAGSVDREFLVVQVGRRLWFFNALASNVMNSAVGSIDLWEAPVDTKFSLASSEGMLVVVCGISSIILVEYNTTSGTFSYQLKRLTTRDVWGMQDTDPAYNESPNYRGGTDAIRVYNLQNQSWGVPRVNLSNWEYYATWYDAIDPLRIVGAPSNAQTVWLGMTVRTEPATEGGGGRSWEGFSYSIFNAADGKLPEAPKGYFVIDVLNRGGSRREAVAKNFRDYPQLIWYPTTSFPADLTLGGPTAVAEFAGRVFYSGFSGEVYGGDDRSPNYTNYIFFSKLVTKKSEITECYQDGDPTSREMPDIVDTDGGFFRISEAKNIISMFQIGGGLAVIATNGVWVVTGENDYGFSATNYKTTKISEVGISSQRSLVREGSSVYFWSDDSAHILGKDQFGDFKVESITLPRIQKFYDEIPTTAKQQAVGVYDSVSKTVRWLFRRGPESGNEELVYDILLKCFYKNKIEMPSGYDIEVVSAFNTPPYSQVSVIEDVIVDSDLVMVESDYVNTVRNERISTYKDAKYLYALRDSSGYIKIGLASFNDETFVDFRTLSGTGKDAYAYAITGAAIMDDSSIDKQIPYITMHFERTENRADSEGNLVPPSGCIIKGQWSFASGIQSKKWSPAQQAYRFRAPLYPGEISSDWDNGFSVVTSKSKMRGKGPAFALRLETEPKKDCRVLGWNIAVNGNPVA